MNFFLAIVMLISQFFLFGCDFYSEKELETILDKKHKEQFSEIKKIIDKHKPPTDSVIQEQLEELLKKKSEVPEKTFNSQPILTELSKLKQGMSALRQEFTNRAKQNQSSLTQHLEPVMQELQQLHQDMIKAEDQEKIQLQINALQEKLNTQVRSISAHDLELSQTQIKHELQECISKKLAAHICQLKKIIKEEYMKNSASQAAVQEDLKAQQSTCLERLTKLDKDIKNVASDLINTEFKADNTKILKKLNQIYAQIPNLNPSVEKKNFETLIQEIKTLSQGITTQDVNDLKSDFSQQIQGLQSQLNDIKQAMACRSPQSHSPEVPPDNFQHAFTAFQTQISATLQGLNTQIAALTQAFDTNQSQDLPQGLTAETFAQYQQSVSQQLVVLKESLKVDIQSIFKAECEDLVVKLDPVQLADFQTEMKKNFDNLKNKLDELEENVPLCSDSARTRGLPQGKGGAQSSTETDDKATFLEKIAVLEQKMGGIESSTSSQLTAVLEQLQSLSHGVTQETFEQHESRVLAQIKILKEKMSNDNKKHHINPLFEWPQQEEIQQAIHDLQAKSITTQNGLATLTEGINALEDIKTDLKACRQRLEQYEARLGHDVEEKDHINHLFERTQQEEMQQAISDLQANSITTQNGLATLTEGINALEDIKTDLKACRQRLEQYEARLGHDVEEKDHINPLLERTQQEEMQQAISDLQANSITTQSGLATLTEGIKALEDQIQNMNRDELNQNQNLQKQITFYFQAQLILQTQVHAAIKYRKNKEIKERPLCERVAYLHGAIKEHDRETVKQLVQQDEYKRQLVNHVFQGCNALHLAIYENQLEIFTILLPSIDLTTADKFERTVIQNAEFYDRSEMLDAINSIVNSRFL